MMKRFMGPLILACLLLVGNRSFADQAADEAAIAAIDAQWVAVVATKDAAATADLYAEDGMITPAGAPAAVGREAVAAAWAGLMGLPGFALTFAPTLIVVAESGDIAYDVGTYALGFDGEGGRIEDQDKYVVAWKKVAG
ncbi:MAG: DUF4440 domain-containing protein [Alphaproteobacteria bacterium]|nr:DUF4440 domain-containing protein [Alphaproteobacteria bacterium]